MRKIDVDKFCQFQEIFTKQVLTNAIDTWRNHPNSELYHTDMGLSFYFYSALKIPMTRTFGLIIFLEQKIPILKELQKRHILKVYEDEFEAFCLEKIKDFLFPVKN